jgi:hypothetical protein
MPIINPSFETGDFTGWTVVVPGGGSTAVVTSFNTPFAPFVTFNPVQGNFFALLKTDGSGNFTSVSQTFFACAGDEISGWAFFQTPEFPGVFNDFAEVRILLGAALVATPYFASVNTTGDTGWVNWSYTFTAPGTYTLEARVTNVGDNVEDSYMGLDAINLVTIPPTITCPPDITIEIAPGQGGVIINYPEPDVSDNCPGVTAVCSPPSGSFFPVGTTTVTCTATDDTGNTATCSFTITVVEQRFRLSSKMVLDLRLKLLQNQQIRIQTDENDQLTHNTRNSSLKSRR